MEPSRLANYCRSAYPVRTRADDGAYDPDIKELDDRMTGEYDSDTCRVMAYLALRGRFRRYRGGLAVRVAEIRTS